MVARALGRKSFRVRALGPGVRRGVAPGPPSGCIQAHARALAPDREVDMQTAPARFGRILPVAALVSLLLAAPPASADPGEATRPGTEAARTPAQDTAAILEAARAFFPEAVGGGERQEVELLDYDALDEVARVSATYDHPGMPYQISVYFYPSGDTALADKIERVREGGGEKPHTTHQGFPVHKWAFEGMGSGVGLQVQRQFDIWVEVASPRLTEEMRKKAEGQGKHPAPPPEAGLEKLDLKGQAFRDLVDRVAAAQGTGG